MQKEKSKDLIVETKINYFCYNGSERSKYYAYKKSIKTG
jgi:hypothetical protein